MIDWPTDIESARKVQDELRSRVRLGDDSLEPAVIAGVDVSYNIESNLTRAFIVLMKPGELKPLASVMAELPTTFPYIPGFLSFREIPAILAAVEKLPQKPDLYMIDGQGIAHPRRLGIAAHLGVLLDMPTIGVAKSRLYGRHDPVGPNAGDAVPLYDKDEIIGFVLRSKTGCNPLYISAGHRITQTHALDVVRVCLTKYRLPEPTRLADKLSKEKPAMKGGLL